MTEYNSVSPSIKYRNKLLVNFGILTKEKTGTNKLCISKTDINSKDILFSTLQRIINEGIGVYLDISIRLEKK